jgi:hypothetical protein
MNYLIRNRQLVLPIVTLLTAVVTNLDRAKELWQVVFPPPPPQVSGTWVHKSSRNPQDLANTLNLSKVDPTKVAANCTIGGTYHIWYQSGTGSGKFIPRDVPWSNEANPTMNYFYNDGKIVPIGWPTNPTNKFAYFEVVP